MSKYTKEERSAHLSFQKESGMSVKDYCKSSNINVGTFHYWLKRERSKRATVKDFTELVPNNRTTAESISVIRIKYPTGMCIEIPLA